MSFINVEGPKVSFGLNAGDRKFCVVVKAAILSNLIQPIIQIKPKVKLILIELKSDLIFSEVEFYNFFLLS